MLNGTEGGVGGTVVVAGMEGAQPLIIVMAKNAAHTAGKRTAPSRPSMRGGSTSRRCEARTIVAERIERNPDRRE